jgi:phage terminase large subunit
MKMTTKGKKVSDLPEEQQKMFATPAGFARFYLGLNPHATHEKVMNACGRMGAQIVFRAANEVGKTSYIACLVILWWLFVFPKGKVISTAGVYRQVTEQLVPCLHRYSGRFPKWDFLKDRIVIGGTTRYLGFSTSDPGYFEGFHGSLDEPLLIIFDEAKSIKQGIYDAAERCKPQVFLQMSSPGQPEGPFYNNCTRLASFFQQFKLTQPECPWHDKAEIQRRIDKYGMNHPLVRSMIFAEFMEFVDNALLSLAAYEHCRDNPPSFKPGERHAFCDFAAGRDENVLGVRLGNRVWIEKAWRDPNTMSAVGQFVLLFSKLKKEIGLQPYEIEGDADGLGKPMLDRIVESGWNILPFRGGDDPLVDREYFNRIAEVWGLGTRAIQRQELIFKEHDDELMTQLINRKSKVHSSGKFWIETKEEMKKRGLGSPDRADSVLGAAMPLRRIETKNLIHHADPFPDWPEQAEMRVDSDLIKGMETGA